jgi:repressor LexA
MKRLTRRQQEVLDFIQEWIREKRYPPSVREIATRFGLKSASGVHKHVKALVRKNYIAKDDFLSRSIRVLGEGDTPQLSQGNPALKVPVTGILVAGGSVLRTNTDAASLAVSSAMLPEPRDAYALQIGGDHMQDDGLVDGDWVLVMPHRNIRNGQVVVATVRALETVIRRFHRDQETVRLEGLQPGQPAVSLPARDVHVQGVVAGVWRQFR